MPYFYRVGIKSGVFSIVVLLCVCVFNLMGMMKQKVHEGLILKRKK